MFASRVVITGVAVACVAATLSVAIGIDTGSAALGPVAAHRTFNCSIRSTVNNRYVAAETSYPGGRYGVLRARAPRLDVLEQFQCVAFGRSSWAIRSKASGKYAAVELAYTGATATALRARAPSIQSPELFLFVFVGSCSCYAIRSTNKRYVTAEVGYHNSLGGLLRARVTTPGSGEHFQLADLAVGTPTTTTPRSGTLFDERFDATKLDTTKWTAMNRPGDASNSEIGCYKPSNVTESSGSLAIRTAADTSCAGYSYTSGMIQTKSFNFTYGTVEFRAKFAGGAGPWPAVWMLGANCQASNVISADNIAPCKWPDPGSDEVDIAEIVAGNKGNVNEFVFMSGGNGGCSSTTTDTSQNWHTYQLVWAPGNLTWKIDGATTCTETSHVPSTPMFLIVNTAVGGAGGGTVNPSTLPQLTNVDYITVTSP